MSNAGYGNHDAPKPGSAVGERASTDAAAQKPGAGATDRPGTDLGGAGDVSATEGAMAGTHANPQSGGDALRSPGSDTTTPRATADIGRDSTPGEGASAKEAQGNEVDPGVG